MSTDNASVQEARQIAARLRALADRIDERAQRGPSINIGDLRIDNGEFATDIVHAIMSGVANLHLDALVRAASQADRSEDDAS